VLDDDNSRVTLVTPVAPSEGSRASDEPVPCAFEQGAGPKGVERPPRRGRSEELAAANVDDMLAQSGERERADRLADASSISIAGRSARGEPMADEQDFGVDVSTAEEDSADERAFTAVIEHVHRSRKFDFSGYRRSSVVRRIRRRMQAVGIESPAEYLAYLESYPDEIQQLFETLLINVTSFFRDPAAWEALAGRLPSVIDVGGEAPVRVWSAGCSSGEEPYTLAMLLAELLGPDAYAERVKIYATDIDEQALAHARQAVYPPKAIDAVPPALVEKYFTRTGQGFVFDAALRRAVVFGRHDLVQDAPIPRIDVLVCRNTLMYFNAEAQTRVLERLRFALAPTGVLFLGKAEMLLAHADLFKPLDLKQRIFGPVPGRSVRAAPGAEPDEPLRIDRAPAGSAESARLSSNDSWARILRAAFDRSPTPQLVLDADGRLLMVNHEGMRAFGLTSSDLGRPLGDLEIAQRSPDLRLVASTALPERRAKRLDAVERVRDSGDKSFFDVHVTPLVERGVVLGAQITFVDVTEVHRRELLLRRANLELEAAQEELQARAAELEATHAELRSALGELEAMNQELQCTNEELEATNEELQTINEELRRRDAEIARLGSICAAAVERMRTAESTGLETLRTEDGAFDGESFGAASERILKACLGSRTESVADVEGVADAEVTDPKSMTCKVAVVPLQNELKKGVIVLVEEVR